MNDIYKARINNYPNTNFECIMQELTPTMLAVLLSESVFVNSCNMCTKKDIRVCDKNCSRHIYDWLTSESDQHKLERMLKLLDSYANNSDSIMKEE